MRATPLPLYLLFLVAQAALTLAGPHAVLQRAHHFAASRSKGLASDLRLAFSVVPPRRRQRSELVKRNGQCVVALGITESKHSSNDDGASGDNPGSSAQSSSSSASSSSSGSPGSSSSTSTRAAATSSSRAATTTSQHQPTSTSTTASQPAPTPASPWRLVESHEGSNFFEGWDFFTFPDSTNGIVDYLNEQDGRNANLLSVNDNNNAVMRIETTPTVPANRKSIRITTRSTWNGGLFIMDAVHMPTGCGTWPAFWSNGPNWPTGGEIDIAESVHNYTNNQATLHTSPGCRLPSSNPSDLGISGSLLATQDCAAETTSNEGCGIRSPDSNSVGMGFNANGGGVYAMLWNGDGISVFFFPRESIPSDISASAPRPTSWGLPQARFPASGCNPSQFFTNHHLIFSSTLCGDWAGGVWNIVGIPGQEQSCAQRTGFSTCEDFVRASGASFNEAYWEVRNVKIYQLQN
ncbi:hypothetical protein BDN71DRAFT_1458977 [Pleurotus eryngii]|uniref:GH16 domain-containing protein n=1 Tax=Pleurotus eryngii TaxID=5323 RepID=A0A9P6D123_PLEER|nr:hypothetical protein BDN71DRAFT_1458977 [Pleurotus eryngii]